MGEEDKFPVPQASSSKIYVDLNENSYTFNRKAYKQEFLNGLITKEEWDQLFVDAGKIMVQAWAKKKAEDEIKMPKWYVLVFVISLILCIIYMATLYTAGFTEGDNLGLATVALVSICLCTIATFVVATINFTRKPEKPKNLEDIMQEDIDAFFDNVNFKYRGKLNFVYMPTTKWIECNILDPRNYQQVGAEESFGKENLVKYMPNEAFDNGEVIDPRDVENGARWSERHSRAVSNAIN